MEKLKSENVSLKYQVQYLIKERENVKSEYQKLFDSIKKIRTQTQGKINELIKHVNQKTYAYAEVGAQNQDLLITISELKAKLKNVDKGLIDASSVRGQSNVASKNVVLNKKIVTVVDVENALKAKDILCVSCAKNVLIPCHDKCLANYKLNVHSKVRRALFTTPRTVKSKFEDTTPVVSKTRFSFKTTQSKYLDTTIIVSKTKIVVVTPLSAKHKVSSAFKTITVTLRDMEADELNQEDSAEFDGNTLLTPYDALDFAEAESSTTLDPLNMHDTFKPKNIKEAMSDHNWIESMQDELNQFLRLDVWELVPRPDGKNIIAFK
ncbi:hypothetical protein Tco_0794708 [Tanacetum coccineum]